MSCTKIENALKTVLPDAVYKVQAPETTNDGEPLLRYLVWTPTGDRYAYANSRHDLSGRCDRGHANRR